MLNSEFFNRDINVARVPIDGNGNESPSGSIDDVSMSPDLKDIILENARGPKKVSGDAGSVEQHSLSDQIAAERFLASKKATRQGLGIRLVKLQPDGTT